MKKIFVSQTKFKRKLNILITGRFHFQILNKEKGATGGIGETTCKEKIKNFF